MRTSRVIALSFIATAALALAAPSCGGGSSSSDSNAGDSGSDGTASETGSSSGSGGSGGSSSGGSGGSSGSSSGSSGSSGGSSGSSGGDDSGADAGSILAAARATIKHVVIINQENRSFDHYFGTFPGADGIPMDGGVPTVCNTDPKTGICQAPYHDVNDKNYGGPHGHNAFTNCVGDGGMNGFINSAETGDADCPDGSLDPDCLPGSIDVMGYHTDGEIPNYWAYAENFVLQDHLFEPVSSFSLPDHLYMVSAWSATCTPANDPTNCVSDLVKPGGFKGGDKKNPPEYAWTDITFLLHAKNVSWNYYVAHGVQPDCEDGLVFCDAGSQDYTKPGFWNILPWFDDVTQDGQIANIQDTKSFYDNITAGNLATISWLIPSDDVSEHPANLITRGQAYVTELINAVMNSPFWDSTVIFLTWDDWGGFYDHMNPLPETVDQNGYGIRVPGLTISPWVKKGFIDKQVLSHDAYLKFIEDIFLDSQRLDPSNDGRADNRPTVRETVPQLGDLLNEFDFNQTPLPKLVLEPCPSGVDTDGSTPCVP